MVRNKETGKETCYNILTIYFCRINVCGDWFLYRDACTQANQKIISSILRFGQSLYPYFFFLILVLNRSKQCLPCCRHWAVMCCLPVAYNSFAVAMSTKTNVHWKDKHPKQGGQQCRRWPAWQVMWSERSRIIHGASSQVFRDADMYKCTFWVCVVTWQNRKSRILQCGI